MNESVDATRCQGLGDCKDGRECLTHHLWCQLSEQIHDFLNGISLGELVRQHEAAAREACSAGGEASDNKIQVALM